VTAPVPPLATLFAGLAARRAPGVLYHYTSPGALLGILHSRSFWATNIRFLNDAKEFELALELLEELLDQKIEAASSRYDRGLYAVLQEGLSQAHSSEVFVASFSEDGDQLGQWRAYCPVGTGYAIGVAPAELCRARGDRGRLHLLRCLYEEQEQLTLLERLIGLAETYADNAKLPTSSNQDRVYREAFKLFAAWLPAAAAVIKHPSFSEEREWRLVAPSSFFDDPRPEVRPARSMLIPYFRFVLADANAPIQLARLVVGPTPHSTLAIHGAEALCAAYDIRNPRIELSEIPYRTW
jgi:hypothetical protein